MDGPSPRGPASPDRRRLLLALGFGALNVGALSQLARSGGRPGDIGSGQGQGGDGTGDRRSTTAAGDSAAAVVDPPALDGAAEQPGADHVYDTVISGGRVIDPETGFDGVAHVGIDGGTITAVSLDPLQGRRSIDATNLVVSPGFIDLLSYEMNGHGEWFKIGDGVTSNIGCHGLNFEAGEFFGRFAAEGSPVHYGGAYDSPFRRNTVLGLDPGEAASAHQLDQLADDCRQQLAAGWIGVDAEPEYTPGVEYAELLRLAQVAAEARVPMFVHGRYSDDQPPGTNADTIGEILQLARDARCSMHVEHIISTGGTFTMAESLQSIQAAIDEGLDVSACMYPYNFWATYLGSPRFADGWQERFRITYDDLVVAGTGEVLSQATFASHQRANDLVAAFGIPDADVVTCLQSPIVMIGSDAILEPDNKNHPRAAGCFSRTLGVFARDQSVLSLRDALAKMTIMPARRLQGSAPAMARKGRLQRGADADITVFDPATVADRATIEDPAQPSVGIEWVLVAGQIVKDPDEVHMDVKPGQPVTSTA